jgi:hypothetical protein
VAGYHEVLVHQADGSGITARLVGLAERIQKLAWSPDGQKITESILGVAADLDLYGGMIDARINQALEKLGNTARILHN